jgi:hypothetical protein
MILKAVYKNDKTWMFQIKRRFTYHWIEQTNEEYSTIDYDVLLIDKELIDFDGAKEDIIWRYISITFLDEDLNEVSIAANCDLYLLNDSGDTIDVINRVHKTSKLC